MITPTTRAAIEAYARLLQAEDAAARAQRTLDTVAALLTNAEATAYARATINIDEARDARNEARDARNN